MSASRGWKQGLARVSRLRGRGEYAAALAEVDVLLTAWPGSGHLHELRARLIQLQDEGGPPLAHALAALRRAGELDPNGPKAGIELGYFLDNVKDDPAAAAEAFAPAVALARRLLIDGLIGQAKASQQLGRRREVRRCVAELLQLTGNAGELPPEVAEEVRDLLGDMTQRSA